MTEIMIGNCRECDEPIYLSDEIPNRKLLFECRHCGHPHGLDDIVGLDLEILKGNYKND